MEVAAVATADSAAFPSEFVWIVHQQVVSLTHRVLLAKVLVAFLKPQAEPTELRLVR